MVVLFGPCMFVAPLLFLLIPVAIVLWPPVLIGSPLNQRRAYAKSGLVTADAVSGSRSGKSCRLDSPGLSNP